MILKCILERKLTFGGQSTFNHIVNRHAGAFITIFDTWRPENLIASGYT